MKTYATVCWRACRSRRTLQPTGRKWKRRCRRTNVDFAAKNGASARSGSLWSGSLQYSSFWAGDTSTNPSVSGSAHWLAFCSIYPSVELLKHFINRSRVEILKEMKQVQLQMLELQASLTSRASAALIPAAVAANRPPSTVHCPRVTVHAHVLYTSPARFIAARL